MAGRKVRLMMTIETVTFQPHALAREILNRKAPLVHMTWLTSQKYLFIKIPCYQKDPRSFSHSEVPQIGWSTLYATLPSGTGEPAASEIHQLVS